MQLPSWKPCTTVQTPIILKNFLPWRVKINRPTFNIYHPLEIQFSLVQISRYYLKLQFYYCNIFKYNIVEKSLGNYCLFFPHSQDPYDHVFLLSSSYLRVTGSSIVKWVIWNLIDRFPHLSLPCSSMWKCWGFLFFCFFFFWELCNPPTQQVFILQLTVKQLGWSGIKRPHWLTASLKKTNWFRLWISKDAYFVEMLLSNNIPYSIKINLKKNIRSTL